MNPSTDLAPGEVAHVQGGRGMLVLALLVALAWGVYLFFVDVRLQLQMDAALATVPPGFAKVLKAITLGAVFLFPALILFFFATRLRDRLYPTHERMLDAYRDGSSRAAAQARQFVEKQLAGLPEGEAAELRPHMEEMLRRTEEDAARRLERYTADPGQMQRDLQATVAEIRAKSSETKDV